MATLAELEAALVNADRAGDSQAASAFASEIVRLRGSQPKTGADLKAIAEKRGEVVDPTAEMGMGRRALAGAGKAFADIGRGVGQVVGMVPQEEIDAAKMQDKPLMRTGAGFAGNIAGNVAATLPAALVPGANTVVGAGAVGGLLGGLQPVASDESRLQNALLGAAGGAGGQMAANTIGRAIRPVQSSLDEPLRGLAARAENVYNIPLNAAQKTGSKPLKIIDSVLDNMPLTASKQAVAKGAQAKAFNRAALGTIGESAEQATPDVLNAARTRIGQQFNDLSSRNAVGLGDDFLESLSKIESNINEFTKPGVRDAIDKALNLAADGKISGQTYQKVRSTLGKQSSDAFKSGNSELGQALRAIKSGLDEAADASISAADKQAWGQARAQWQALKVIEKAAAPTSADAVSGNISPAKLAQALQSVDKKGFTYGTRTDELPDLARIGQAFLKNQIPDSGTAQRQFYQRFLENPLAAAWEGATGGMSLPVQALLNSKAGQKYLSQGTLNPTAAAWARALKQGAGMAGAALPVALNAEK